MLLLFRPSPGGGINLWGLTVLDEASLTLAAVAEGSLSLVAYSEDSSLGLTASSEGSSLTLAASSEDSALTLTVLEEQTS